MSGPPAQSPLMQFNNRPTENSFKISLRSPNVLKNLTPSHGIQVGTNVTSTNPKTPSPSTNDVSNLKKSTTFLNNCGCSFWC